VLSTHCDLYSATDTRGKEVNINELSIDDLLKYAEKTAAQRTQCISDQSLGGDWR